MKTRIFILSLIIFFLLPVSFLSQTNFIYNKVNEKFKNSNDIKIVNNLITISKQNKDFSKISESISSYELFDFQENVALELNTNSPNLLTIEINYLGENLILDLVNTNYRFKDLSIETSDNKYIKFSDFKANFYEGIVRGEKESIVSLGIYENQIEGLISRSKGNIVIGKTLAENKILMYNENSLMNSQEFNCETEFSPLTQEEIEIYSQSLNLSNNQSISKCTRLYLETEFDIFQALGNLNSVLVYVTSLYNNVATIYDNDGIPTLLSQVFVWTTIDPYTATGSGALLSQFQSNTTSINGDLGQLLTFRNIGGGIAAGFDGLCNSNIDNSLSVSGNLENNFPNFPTYSWSVMVVTHEFGHLFGSRHTHACVWNGNNTAIDGCAGYTEGNCNVPPLPPANGGTIMSYCHWNQGINFSLGFGIQPANVIKNKILQASCIQSCKSCPEIYEFTVQEPAFDHVYEAIDYIIAKDNYSSTGQNITFSAGKFIELLPNAFISAVRQEYFLAKIEGCTLEQSQTSRNSSSVYDIRKEDIKLLTEITLYPNPTSDVLNIDTGSEELFSWQLLDLSGKVLRKGSEKTTNVRDLTKGMYMMVITTNKQTVSKKVIIE